MKGCMPSDPQDEHLDKQVAVLVISLMVLSIALPLAIATSDVWGMAFPIAMSALWGARAAWQLCKIYAHRKGQAGSGQPS